MRSIVWNYALTIHNTCTNNMYELPYVLPKTKKFCNTDVENMYFLWERFYLFPNSIFPYYKTRHITRKSSGLYKFDDWCNIINMVVRIFVEWDGVWLYCLDDDVTAMIRVGLVSSSHWSPGSTPTHSHLWRGRVTIWIISHQLNIQLTYPSLTPFLPKEGFIINFASKGQSF